MDEVSNRTSSRGSGARNAGSRSIIATDGLDDSAPVPLFHQIFLVFREKIIDGTYALDTFLPSEHEIAAAYGVARVTAKRALDKLAEEGLVERRRGLGTRVTFRATRHSIEGSVDSLLKSLQSDRRNRIRLVSFEYVPASPAVAEALRLPTGSLVQRAVRVRSAEGRPFTVLVTHVPEAIGRKFDRADLAKEPLYALLERANVEVDSAEQKFQATLADAQLGKLLEIQVGSPLLKIVRTIYDKDDVPVEYLIALFRSDVYRYRMVMKRNSDKGSWTSNLSKTPPSWA